MQMSERTRFTTGTNEQGLLTTKARAAPADGGLVSVAGQTTVLLSRHCSTVVLLFDDGLFSDARYSAPM